MINRPSISTDAPAIRNCESSKAIVGRELLMIGTVNVTAPINSSNSPIERMSRPLSLKAG
jgi:hypothetical protein